MKITTTTWVDIIMVEGRGVPFGPRDAFGVLTDFNASAAPRLLATFYSLKVANAYAAERNAMQGAWLRHMVQDMAAALSPSS